LYSYDWNDCNPHNGNSLFTKTGYCTNTCILVSGKRITFNNKSQKILS